MNLRRVGLAWWSLILLPALAAGQDTLLPPGDQEPMLRLQPGGPSSLVTALAFSPEGNTLYEAGWDKVVRVWARNPAAGTFGLDERATYRVPIGPGTDGAINALALSADGTWLAVAGNGIVRGGAGFRRAGLMYPAGASSDSMRRDRGLIYVFNTRTDPHAVKILRGHQGPVLSLAFAPDRADKPPLLVSTALERDRIGAVRLWDVATGEYLDGLWNLPVPGTKPALAVWHAGPGRKQVGAAIAWGDGLLRLWDPEHDLGRPISVADGKNDDTLALLPDTASGHPRFLSGSFRNGHGQLTTWETAAGRAPPVDAGSPVVFPPEGTLLDFPRAVALVADRPGAAPHHAAVVIQRIPARGTPQDRPREVSLALVDLSPGRFGAVTSRVPLWRVEGPLASLPTLAVDPTGRTLAVAGNPAREILVFALADLLRGRAVPQRLRGDGVTIGRAEFVKDGPDRGLRLAEPTGEVLIFDFTKSQLTANRADWKVDAPELGGWRADVLPGVVDASGRAGPWTLAAHEGAGPARRIALRPGQVISEFALLPPRPPRREPVAAIAYEERGEPGLGLYNVLTGEQIRQLTGHSERVRSLAFSDDGLRLVSASEDRTVCVWSLADLDRTLGKRGTIAGLVVNTSDGRLAVSGVEPGHSGGGVVRTGDAILGLVTAGALRPLASVTAFYEALSLLGPRQSVILRTERAGRGPSDVTLPVGQATDERKPLLTLFVTRGDAPERRSWIGWSPLGPFESSGKEAERLLGWHFNTGQPDAPTRFAMVDQDLKFRRPGLLRSLIEGLAPAPEPVPPPLPRPNMSLNLEPEGEVDGRGQLVVRRPPARLSLTLLEQDIDPDSIESIKWAVDDSDWNEMSSAADRVYSAEIPHPGWPRGVHLIRASLRTRESEPQVFTVRREIRYQPPPPSLKAALPGKALVVDRPEFRYRAQVDPAGGRARIHLVHRAADGHRSQEDLESETPLEIDRPLILKPGVNTIELVAENRDALPGHEELETNRLPPLVVVYNRAPARPPEITLESLIGIRDGTETGPIPSIDWGRPIVVSVPSVKVVGKIGAREKLSRAEWSDGASSRMLSGFVADRAPSFDVGEVIALTPGPTTFRLRARAADSEPSESGFTIDYRPPLPELTDLTLDPPELVVYQGRDGGPPRVRLKARLLAPPERHPFTAVVLINGTPRAGTPVIDELAELLTADVALEPGDNSIQVRLSNAWNVSWVTEATCVTYRRPPRNLIVKAPAVGDRPFVDIAATAESPDDLPLTRVQIEVQGGGPGVPDKLIDSAEFRREGSSWAISAKGVPIEPGENTVRVRAWNGDGPCLGPGLASGLVYRAPPPPKPEVAILSPGRDVTVSTPGIALEIRVRSSSPLKSVEIVRTRPAPDHPVVFSADLSTATRDLQGNYEFHDDPLMTLDHHENLLQLRAVNAGGEATARVVVSYIPPPVHIAIDRLVPKDRAEPPVVPPSREGGPARLRNARFVLHGRVIWPDAETKRQKVAARVQISVNGFPHVHTTLRARPGHDLEAEFQAPIVLHGKDNHVVVELPQLPHEASDRPEFDLACAIPDDRQRLHLLIIGVGSEDEVALRDRALQALQGSLREGSTTLFHTPAFSEGRIYGPLSKDVRRDMVLFQLGAIKSAINPLNPATEIPNDVVMIYYQGGEWIEDGRSYLRLRQGRGRGKGDVIATEDMARFFTQARGAQLILLDVTRSNSVTPILLTRPGPPKPDGSPVGLLRFSWLRPSGGTQADPPADAHLLGVLEDALPRSSTIKDLDSGIARKHSELKVIYPDLIYERHIPENLSDLIVGRP